MKRRKMTGDERELEALKLFGSRERIQGQCEEIPEETTGRRRRAVRTADEKGATTWQTRH